MGTDIHMWVEVRASEADPWRLARTGPMRCVWCDGSGKGSYELFCDSCRGTGVGRRPFFGERRYALFTALAGVREEPGVPVISKPRGWPEDTSTELRAHIEACEYEARLEILGLDVHETLDPELAWVGDHSASWVSLAEILAYQATHKSIPTSGVVSPSEFSRWRAYGAPEEWCGGVAGPSVVALSNEAMARLVDGPLIKHTSKQYYTTVRWERALVGAWGETFCLEFLPICLSLGDPNNVRLVFNFDS